MAGLNVKPSVRNITIPQSIYIDNINIFPVDGTFERFRSLRAEVTWVTHCRPDICCATVRAAQAITELAHGVDKSYVTLLNSAIIKLKSDLSLTLKYERLNEDSLQLRVYTDASFGTNRDYSTQLGYIVMLCDKYNKAHMLDFESRKCKRITRSVMGGEVYAFTEGFDCSFLLRHDLQRLYGKLILLQIRTDSKQMFDVITKASSTTERRLMIDIAAARQAYELEEISNIGLVRSEHNIADGLTKPKFCKALGNLLKTGMDLNPVEQWIIRTSTRSSF